MAELIKKYTGRFQALWDNYFWAKEQIEHRKNTIGMEEKQWVSLEEESIGTQKNMTRKETSFERG